MTIASPRALSSNLCCWVIRFSIGCFVMAALPAGAVDGLIEINDAGAVAGGVTPGDLPDYPITISRPGSYRLTGDLSYSGANTDVLQITADNVHLDLNGFSIRCLYVFTPCAGTGIGVNAASRLNVTIRNGTVRDMGSHGIQVGPFATIEDVRALSNGGSGIQADSQARVRRCTVHGSGGDGIRASGASVIEGNTIASSSGDGIFAEFGSVISSNASIDNTGNGIRCASDCNVFRNSVLRNGVGMLGIGLFQNNIATGNTGPGLDLGVGGYGGNVFYGNDSPSPTQVNGGIELGPNLCGPGDTTCP